MKRYVCVLSTDNFLNGVLILNENLKFLDSKYDLLCLINENISNDTKAILKYFNINYKIVDSIPYNTQDEIHPHWKYTFDKLNVFSLTEYEKIVYLDIDIMILHNIDNLFDKPSLSMVRDYPWHPESFSSGIMVVEPNEKDYENLKMKTIEKDLSKNKIGDQDIINDYFKKINELDQSYCVTRQVLDYKGRIYNPINSEIELKYLVHSFKKVDNINILHYAGPIKPFMLNDSFEDIDSELYMMFYKKVKRRLNEFKVKNEYNYLISSIMSLDIDNLINNKSKYVYISNKNINKETLNIMINKMEDYQLDICEAYNNLVSSDNSHWEDELLFMNIDEVIASYNRGEILSSLENKLFNRDFLINVLTNVDESYDITYNIIKNANRVLLINAEMFEV